MLKRASLVMALVISGMMLLPLCAHEDDDSYDDDHVYPRGSVSITPDQAVAEARKVAPGKVVLSVKLDDEHGAWVYKVRFTDGTEVKVDATTGVVMQVKSPRGGSGSNTGTSKPGGKPRGQNNGGRPKGRRR